MNQEMLQHFQPYSDREKTFLEKRNSGLSVKSNYPLIKAEDLMLNGAQISINQHTRFEHHLEHRHDFVELIYAYVGQSTNIVNRNKVTLRAGELLLLNQWASHENLPLSENDITINFVILPQFFTQTLDMIGDKESELRRFLLGCLRSERQAPGYLLFRVADVLPVQAMLESMIWSLSNKVQHKRSVNQLTMGLLFLHLLDHTDKASSGSKKDDLTFTILQYIEEHFADGTLEELAKHVGYNMNWLSGEIRRLTGSSFRQLQQNRRVSQAKFLLRTTPLPIKDIARQAGYDDTSHFYRLFHEYAGCSPKDYRAGNHTD